MASLTNKLALRSVSVEFQNGLEQRRPHDNKNTDLLTWFGAEPRGNVLKKKKNTNLFLLSSRLHTRFKISCIKGNMPSAVAVIHRKNMKSSTCGLTSCVLEQSQLVCLQAGPPAKTSRLPCSPCPGVLRHRATPNIPSNLHVKMHP